METNTTTSQNFIEVMDVMNDRLSSMLNKIKSGDSNESELFITLIKQLVITVDNRLGDLHDLIDTLEYHGDENLDRARTSLNKLESQLEEVVEYLRKIKQY